MPIQNYVNNVKKRFDSGISTEHSYRGDLQNLLQGLAKGFTVTNEPKRQQCGAPDYIIHKKDVPMGYIEAKDMGVDLNKVEKSEQLKRYLASLDNLILTDYIDFRFFRYGQKVKEIPVAYIENGKVKPLGENYELFTTYIDDFCSFKGQTIKSSEKLAKMMAQKARMMEEVIFNAVKIDDSDNTLKEQLKAFKLILIHDLDEKTFADIYAQTIAYGLFAARLHDETLEDFSRQEARELIPRSNPFLRNLFDYISGAQLDERVVWIVNDLAEIFRATDVKALMADFGKSTQQNDPFLHFYETFLGEYDPKLRKSRGVYYTPEPVVNFIVRAVDDILKTEFNIPDGLADTSKIKKRRLAMGYGTKKGADVYEDVEFHKVQILDPATGTGTFLAEVVKQIYKKFEGQQGAWSGYVENHLIPRVNGFEILMASYTMCHLKLEMLLNETGYKPKSDKTQPRLRVFLTNSLEEVDPHTGNVFASWLSNEATEANLVKRDTPVMVILGNPPYAVSSSNKGEWIDNLLNDYKKDLNERNIQPLSDDYIKFIKYGQYFIDKNGEGILAYISNNSFIDGLIHRQMRKNLLESFDKIYILDLHGNSKKKEISPNGEPDQNVFDIMQGVSINIFVKTGKKSNVKSSELNHIDLWGKRSSKYNTLNNSSLKNGLKFVKLKPSEPNFYFIPKDFSSEIVYTHGFKIDELFIVKAAGIKTHHDDVVIGYTQKELNDQLNKYFMQSNIQNEFFNDKFVKEITYRPFDFRLIYYDTNYVVRHRKEQIKHSLYSNYSLLSGRQTKGTHPNHFYISKSLSEMKTAESTTGSYHYPLYIYPEDDLFEKERTPNLNGDIVNQIAEKLNLTFTSEKEPAKNTFAPIDILDYIYAVLHSPKYRETYKEFLKIDFPRVPYPKDAKYFRKLAELGKEIREIHLLESPVVSKFKTKYPVDGSNVVVNVKYEDERVSINESQYFDKVPQSAWEFYIGGYQPAQKWLKDRKGRALSFEDIVHYQKVIVALSETERLMGEIDKVFEV